MARKSQQLCYEVVVVNNTLQRTLGRLPTRKDVSGTINRNIQLTDGRQEDYSEHFDKEVMTIYERILSVPSLAQIIAKQEKRDGHNSLWNNIGKLVVLASRTAD